MKFIAMICYEFGFAAGFNYDINTLDLTVVRLCFQVFLKDENGEFTRVGKPAVSHCIYDKSKYKQIKILPYNVRSHTLLTLILRLLALLVLVL